MNTADRLRTYLARWPDFPDGSDLHGVAGRVLDAARNLRDDPASVGKGDLFSLIWHWLRHDSLNSGVQSRLTIPSRSAWPLPERVEGSRLQRRRPGREADYLGRAVDVPVARRTASRHRPGVGGAWGIAFR